MTETLERLRVQYQVLVSICPRLAVHVPPRLNASALFRSSTYAAA